MSEKKRLIVGISGASGAIYGIRLLELLEKAGIETHLVVSRAAKATIAAETGHTLAEVMSLASISYPPDDIGAAISSGSFHTLGMIVAPCSMRSLAEIAQGMSASLLTRAADVTLKERRRLVLLVRETPLHSGHLRNMLAVSELGAIVAPPVPAFYSNPQSLEEMVDHTLGRALDLFGIECGRVRRWQGMRGSG